MYPFKYKVSFRVKHPSIDPDKISVALSLKPKGKWKVGEPRKTPTGAPLSGVYKSTYWYCELKHPNDMALNDFLDVLAEKFAAHRKFLRHLVRTGGAIEFFIGWFQGFNSGQEFSWRLFSKLADLQISLETISKRYSRKATIPE